VVASYAKVDQLTGDPIRGATWFATTCTGCHQFRGLGNAVGPDLATYRNKPASDFVLAILDPNAAIEPRFINYEVQTKDGRTLSGVIANESSTSFTLLTGSYPPRETFLRSQVASLKPSKFSLMPEGFETGLDAQKLADLIAYLRLGSPATFGAARNAGENARTQFLKRSHTSISTVSASENLPYPSPFGMAPLHHCRQTDGKSRVEWDATSAESADGYTRFLFPIAMGLISQPAGGFVASINGKYAFDFDVVLHDDVLANDGKIRATYFVNEANGEDSSGILVIELDSKTFPTGAITHFSIAGRHADSQRWFGIYGLESREVVKR